MQDAPDDFEILDEAELQSSADDGGIIRCKKQDLDADEILAHMQAGKLVHKLAVNFQDKLTCVLAEDLSVKRVKFTDIVLEQNEDIDKTDMAAKIDADFVLFSSEIKLFIESIAGAFDLNEK